MPQVDLFQALDALWTKKPLNGDPPGPFIMHRFLASDPDFAIAARYLQKDLREPGMTFQTWRGLLPRGRGAPRLSYVGPKKKPAEEELVGEMMRRLPERRAVVEEILELYQAAGRASELYVSFGVEVPADE